MHKRIPHRQTDSGWKYVFKAMAVAEFVQNKNKLNSWPFKNI